MKQLRKSHFALGSAIAVLLITIAVRLAIASTAAPGYAVADFATGFGASFAGPVGIAPDRSGNPYVGDFVTSSVYKFGPAGGVASAATLTGNLLPQFGRTAIKGQDIVIIRNK